MRVMVTGGVRSGKSRHAERLLADRPHVTYVAAGATDEQDPDPDWVARLAAHRSRRPSAWSTVETRDLAGALATAEGPVLVDCLGTWVTGLLDERDIWDADLRAVEDVVTEAVEAAAAALTSVPDAVLVTNEVGLGVVPAHRSGRLFRDLLGTVNQRLAAECDEVHLVVAGRVLML